MGLPQDQPKPLIQPGDMVMWNQRYRGVVSEVFEDSATVIEHEILGRQATHHLDLTALSPAPPTQ
jgi:hypothetical protein